MKYSFTKSDGTFISFEGELVADVKARPMQVGGNVLQDLELYRTGGGGWMLVTRYYNPPVLTPILLECDEFEVLGDLLDQLLGEDNDDPEDASAVHRELVNRARSAFPAEFEGALQAKMDEGRQERENARKSAWRLLQKGSAELNELKSKDDISLLRSQLLGNMLARLRMMLNGFGEDEIGPLRKKYFELSRAAEALKESRGLWTCTVCGTWVKRPQPQGDMPACAKCSVSTQ